MTWLRIALLMVAATLAVFGFFAVASVVMAAAYILLSWQYESACRELADVNTFVDRLIRGEE